MIYNMQVSSSLIWRIKSYEPEKIRLIFEKRVIIKNEYNAIIITLKKVIVYNLLKRYKGIGFSHITIYELISECNIYITVRSHQQHSFSYIW
jgi:hypothetical protein